MTEITTITVDRIAEALHARGFDSGVIIAMEAAQDAATRRRCNILIDPARYALEEIKDAVREMAIREARHRGWLQYAIGDQVAAQEIQPGNQVHIIRGQSGPIDAKYIGFEGGAHKFQVTEEGGYLPVGEVTLTPVKCWDFQIAKAIWPELLELIER